MKIERTILYQKYLHDLNSSDRKRIDEVRIYTLHPTQVNELLNVWPVNIQDMKKRFRRGDYCFVAEENGKLIHYSWVQVNGFHFIMPAGRTIFLNKRQMCIYHCRTLEEYKGKGIYPTVLLHILNFGYELQVKKALIYTSKENQSSQKGIYKAGFTPYKNLISVQIGHLTLPLMGFGY